jgi:hypothetical protein
MRWILAAALVLFTTSATAATFEQNQLNKKYTEALRKALEATLKDPESVSYQLPAAKPGKSGAQPYCGCYNARNSFGGYVGRRAFFGIFVTMGKDFSFLYPGGDESVDRKMCEDSQLEVPC